MPPPRKIDLMPEDIRSWLKQTLKESGFSGYEQIADDLNAKLIDAGLSISVGKSAVHSFGQEYHDYVKLQEEASGWAEGWMGENGLGDEAQRHSVLFQMVTTVAFKVMKDQIKEGNSPSPQDLHFMGRMLKDLMSSSGMREKMMESERIRAAQEVRDTANADLSKAVDAGIIDQAAAKAARQVMGFE